MTYTLALEKLYTDVQARFALDGRADVSQPFGWNVTSPHVTHSRITWTPGDPSGRLGDITAAMQPGRNPRSLATLLELFTCVISDEDTNSPDDHFKQYKKTRLLYDAWLRAVYLAATGTFQIVDSEWGTTAGFDGGGPRRERRAGAAIRVTATIQAMIPDLPLTDATVGQAVIADVTLSELNVDDHFTVDPEDP